MRTFLLLIASLFVFSLTAQEKSFHDFTVKTIDGKDFSLSKLKGKKVLVVNVASKCGLTPQYQQLQELYAKYSKDKFVIVGFPANNFGKQEPGSNAEIKEFCTANFGVEFPMMEKISVKGDDIAPLYQWLTSKSKNGKEDAEVAWNFQKFLIDEKGNWVGSVPPQVLPNSPEVIAWIENKPVFPEILKTHKWKKDFTRLSGGFVRATPLFNGKNLNGWYTYYAVPDSVADDKETAFVVTDGALHFSGKSMGYACTKSSYKNYYLKVVFRWGEKKYPPRLNSRRDSGVLYHFSENAEDKVWPTSIECQIQEEDCGDYFLVGGTSADSPNQIKEGAMKRIVRTANFENPGQEWNTIEVICLGDKSEHYVNGHLVNEAYNLSVSEGKILLQLEAAEVFYKTVEMIPLK
jgi:glutathione peroxidase